MATLYTDQLTGTNRAENRPTSPEVDNQVRCIHGSYTLTGAEVAADKIILGRLPKGSEVKSFGSYTESVGTVAATATLDVGDDDPSDVNPDRYVDGANVAAAGVDTFSIQPNFVTTADCNLTATFATLTTPSEGGVIKFYVNYLAVQ